MNLDPELIKQACLRASEMLSGMGCTGKIGSFHLMDPNLQSNTLTAILHNLIAWEISRLDPSWTFHPKGGSTPDLTSKFGDGIQVKVTSDATIKGNYVSAGAGLYLTVKYRRTDSWWNKKVAALARDAMQSRKKAKTPLTKEEALNPGRHLNRR